MTVAGRGCFVLRNADLAMDGYGIAELPTVFAFENEDEIPALLETIRALPPAEKQRRMVATVERLRERDDWNSVVAALDAAHAERSNG